MSSSPPPSPLSPPLSCSQPNPLFHFQQVCRINKKFSLLKSRICQIIFKKSFPLCQETPVSGTRITCTLENALIKMTQSFCRTDLSLAGTRWFRKTKAFCTVHPPPKHCCRLILVSSSIILQAPRIEPRTTGCVPPPPPPRPPTQKLNELKYLNLKMSV